MHTGVKRLDIRTGDNKEDNLTQHYYYLTKLLCGTASLIRLDWCVTLSSLSPNHVGLAISKCEVLYYISGISATINIFF